MHRSFCGGITNLLVVAFIFVMSLGSLVMAAPVEIEVWLPASFADGRRDVTLSQLRAEFERLRPDIKVNYQYNLPDRPARGEKYILAAMSETLPALGWLAPEELPILYTEEYMVPIDALADRDGLDKDQFWPGIWGQGVGGRQWGYPFEVGSEALMYNADRYGEVGIGAPPTTWTEFTAIATKLTDIERGFYGVHPLSTSAHNVLRYLWRNGGDILSSDLRTITFDDPQNVAGLQFFFDTRTVNGVSGGHYARGTAAMIEVHAGWYEDEYPFTVGTAPVPIPDGGVRATRNYYKEVVLFKTTPEKEAAAWTFLKWLMSGENNGTWAVASGYLPVTRDALLTEPYATYFRDNRGITPWLDELRYSRYLPPQEIIDVFQNVVTKVLQGTPPATALAEWVRPAQLALDAFHQQYPNYAAPSGE